MLRLSFLLLLLWETSAVVVSIQWCQPEDSINIPTSTPFSLPFQLPAVLPKNVYVSITQVTGLFNGTVFLDSGSEKINVDPRTMVFYNSTQLAGKKTLTVTLQAVGYSAIMNLLICDIDDTVKIPTLPANQPFAMPLQQNRKPVYYKVGYPVGGYLSASPTVIVHFNRFYVVHVSVFPGSTTDFNEKNAVSRLDEGNHYLQLNTTLVQKYGDFIVKLESLINFDSSDWYQITWSVPGQQRPIISIDESLFGIVHEGETQYFGGRIVTQGKPKMVVRLDIDNYSRDAELVIYVADGRDCTPNYPACPTSTHTLEAFTDPTSNSDTTFLFNATTPDIYFAVMYPTPKGKAANSSNTAEFTIQYREQAEIAFVSLSTPVADTVTQYYDGTSQSKFNGLFYYFKINNGLSDVEIKLFSIRGVPLILLYDGWHKHPWPGQKSTFQANATGVAPTITRTAEQVYEGTDYVAVFCDVSPSACANAPFSLTVSSNQVDRVLKLGETVSESTKTDTSAHFLLDVLAVEDVAIIVDVTNGASQVYINWSDKDVKGGWKNEIQEATYKEIYISAADVQAHGPGTLRIMVQLNATQATKDSWAHTIRFQVHALALTKGSQQLSVSQEIQSAVEPGHYAIFTVIVPTEGDLFVSVVGETAGMHPEVIMANDTTITPTPVGCKWSGGFKSACERGDTRGDYAYLTWEDARPGTYKIGVYGKLDQDQPINATNNPVLGFRIEVSTALGYQMSAGEATWIDLDTNKAAHRNKLVARLMKWGLFGTHSETYLWVYTPSATAGDLKVCYGLNPPNPLHCSNYTNNKVVSNGVTGFHLTKPATIGRKMTDNMYVLVVAKASGYYWKHLIPVSIVTTREYTNDVPCYTTDCYSTTFAELDQQIYVGISKLHGVIAFSYFKTSPWDKGLYVTIDPLEECALTMKVTVNGDHVVADWGSAATTTINGRIPISYYIPLDPLNQHGFTSIHMLVKAMDPNLYSKQWPFTFKISHGDPPQPPTVMPLCKPSPVIDLPANRIQKYVFDLSAHTLQFGFGVATITYIGDLRMFGNTTIQGGEKDESTDGRMFWPAKHVSNSKVTLYILGGTMDTKFTILGCPVNESQYVVDLTNQEGVITKFVPNGVKYSQSFNEYGEQGKTWYKFGPNDAFIDEKDMSIRVVTDSLDPSYKVYPIKTDGSVDYSTVIAKHAGEHYSYGNELQVLNYTTFKDNVTQWGQWKYFMMVVDGNGDADATIAWARPSHHVTLKEGEHFATALAPGETQYFNMYATHIALGAKMIVQFRRFFYRPPGDHLTSSYNSDYKNAVLTFYLGTEDQCALPPVPACPNNDSKISTWDLTENYYYYTDSHSIFRANQSVYFLAVNYNLQKSMARANGNASALPVVELSGSYQQQADWTRIKLNEPYKGNFLAKYNGNALTGEFFEFDIPQKMDVEIIVKSDSWHSMYWSDYYKPTPTKYLAMDGPDTITRLFINHTKGGWEDTQHIALYCTDYDCPGSEFTVYITSAKIESRLAWGDTEESRGPMDGNATYLIPMDQAQDASIILYTPDCVTCKLYVDLSSKPAALLPKTARWWSDRGGNFHEVTMLRNELLTLGTGPYEFRVMIVFGDKVVQPDKIYRHPYIDYTLHPVLRNGAPTPITLDETVIGDGEIGSYDYYTFNLAGPTDLVVYLEPNDRIDTMTFLISNGSNVAPTTAFCHNTKHPDGSVCYTFGYSSWSNIQTFNGFAPGLYTVGILVSPKNYTGPTSVRDLTYTFEISTSRYLEARVGEIYEGTIQSGSGGLSMKFEWYTSYSKHTNSYVLWLDTPQDVRLCYGSLKEAPNVTAHCDQYPNSTIHKAGFTGIFMPVVAKEEADGFDSWGYGNEDLYVRIERLTTPQPLNPKVSTQSLVGGTQQQQQQALLGATNGPIKYALLIDEEANACKYSSSCEEIHLKENTTAKLGLLKQSDIVYLEFEEPLDYVEKSTLIEIVPVPHEGGRGGGFTVEAVYSYKRVVAFNSKAGTSDGVTPVYVYLNPAMLNSHQYYTKVVQLYIKAATPLPLDGKWEFQVRVTKGIPPPCDAPTPQPPQPPQPHPSPPPPPKPPVSTYSHVSAGIVVLCLILGILLGAAAGAGGTYFWFYRQTASRRAGYDVSEAQAAEGKL